jgi:poly(ADP-ribose) glycohydrolase
MVSVRPKNINPTQLRDPLGHSTNSGEVLAIDALHYAQLDVQFERRAVDRELLKALAGFSLRTTNSPEPIATGNWGCGAFGGELHLKSG